MAKLGGVFDASIVPERDDFSPVPPGQYVGIIVSSEERDTQKGGKMIVLEIDIQDGEETGRKLFENLNIENSNQKAVDIAFRTLAEIVKAVGKTTIKDTEELHNKRFLMNVVVKPAVPYVDREGNKQDGKPQNEIKKFLPYSGAAPAASSNVAVSTPKTVESKSEEKAAPPWKRKTL